MMVGVILLNVKEVAGQKGHTGLVQQGLLVTKLQHQPLLYIGLLYSYGVLSTFPSSQTILLMLCQGGLATGGLSNLSEGGDQKNMDN